MATIHRLTLLRGGQELPHDDDHPPAAPVWLGIEGWEGRVTYKGAYFAWRTDLALTDTQRAYGLSPVVIGDNATDLLKEISHQRKLEARMRAETGIRSVYQAFERS